MRSVWLAAALAVFVAAEANASDWAFAANVLRFASSVYEVRVERNLDAVRLAAIANYGSADLNDTKQGKFWSAGGGLQALFGIKGTFERGLYAGIEGRGEVKHSQDMGEGELITGNGWAMQGAALLGGRLSARGGLYFGAHGGPRWRYSHTDTSCCGTVRQVVGGSDWGLTAALEIGWMF